MRSRGFLLAVVMGSAIAGPAAAAELPDARPAPTGERGVKSQPPPEREPPSRQQEQLSMISSIPRWPFIAAAGGVFVVMALFGLRRRR